MEEKRPLKKILKKIQGEMIRILDKQYDKMLLFGSYARSEATSDSDIDLLIVMNGDYNYPDLVKRLSPVISDVSLQFDVVITPVFASEDRLEGEDSPLFINIRREGVLV